MPENAALSGADTAKLTGGNHLAPLRLSYVPDTTVGTATVNGTPSFPTGEITVSSPSAGWTNGRKEQTVKITNSAGTVLRGYYRMRATPTATKLYVSELVDADAGLFPVDGRTTGISNGDLCTILDRYDLDGLRPRQAVGIQYEDYDVAAASFNTTPEVIVNVTINGEAGDYAAEVAAGASKAMTCVISVTKWATSSGSSLTYAWTAPAAWTSVSGTNTATLTGNAPAGAYWVRCVVTDSIGGQTTVARFVRIHDPNDAPLEVLIDGVSDERDRTGRTMQVRLKRGDAASVPLGARVILWGAATWGGSDIASASKKFIGYVQTRPYSAKPGDYEATLDIASPMHILDKIGGYAHKFDYASTEWEKLAAGISTIQFVMWWVLRWRTNFLHTFNFTPLSTATTTGRSRTIDLDVQTVGEQLRALAAQVDASIGCRSDGEIICRAHPSLLEDRSAVITRITLDNTMYSRIEIEGREAPETGSARLEGEMSDLSANTPLISQAPGAAVLGKGGSAYQTSRLVFESQTDANQRSGRYYAKENNRYGAIRVTLPGNWDVFEPADMGRVVVEVPAAKSTTGAAYSITCIPESVSKTWIRGRRAAIQLTLEAETNGEAGETVDVPIPNINIYTPPSLPPVTKPPTPPVVPTEPPVVTKPGEPGIVPGEFAIRNTATKLYRTYDVTTEPPTWEEVTLPAFFTDVKMVSFDRAATYNRAAYLLGNDGTDTKIAYTEDIGATTVVWTAGGAIAGIYDQIETFEGAPGTVYIYGAEAGYTHLYDLASSAGGWASFPDTGSGYSRAVGTYTGGTGWVATNNSNPGGTYADIAVRIKKTFSSRYIFKAQMTFNDNPVTGTQYKNGIDATGSGVFITGTTDTGTGITYLKVFDTTLTQVVAWVSVVGDFTPTPGVAGSGAITAMQIWGLGSDPEGSGGTAQAVACSSTDYGAAWTPILIGDTPGSVGGFSAGRYRYVIGAQDAKARIATTVGGAFSDASQGATAGSDPTTILIPWWKIGSTAYANNGTAPDYLIASAALVSSEALWKVVSGVKTAITPSVTGTKALGIVARGLASWKGKQFIYLGDVSGTIYAFATSDSGTTWTATSMANAKSVTPRRYGGSGNMWVIAQSSTGLKISTDGGSTWSLRTASGTNIYAEIFG